MEAQTIEPTIKACLADLHAKLKAAEQIAKAAQACAEAGSLAEAVRISMDIEQLIYEAGRVHEATALLARMARG